MFKKIFIKPFTLEGVRLLFSPVAGIKPGSMDKISDGVRLLRPIMRSESIPFVINASEKPFQNNLPSFNSPKTYTWEIHPLTLIALSKDSEERDGSFFARKSKYSYLFLGSEHLLSLETILLSSKLPKSGETIDSLFSFMKIGDIHFLLTIISTGQASF